MTTTTLTGLSALAAVSLAVGAQAADITENLSAKVDIRNRFEFIDQDDKDDTRERFRVRARAQLNFQSTDWLTLSLRAASGGEDPVSTNQSFDDGFSTKDLRLDRAYARITALEGWTLDLGKVPNSFIETGDLIWDGDLNFEGASLGGGLEMSDGVDLDVNLGAFVTEERSSADDSYLFAAQAAGTVKPGDDLKIQGGVSFYGYTEMEGNETLFDETDSFGNSTVAVLDDEGVETGNLTYITDYTLVEFFGSAGMDVGLPLKLFGSAVVNTDADDEDTAFVLGAKLGKAKDQGSYEFGYDYRDLEADAVVGAFTDSDSGGGGTNIDGHRVKGKYQFTKHVQGAVTLFFNGIDPDGADVDYTRGQFDLIVKF